MSNKSYGSVDNSLWRESKFRILSDDAKYIFLYLKTCSHQNIVGCFYLPLMYACSDLNWQGAEGFERVSKGFTELSENGFIRHCSDTDTVLLVKHLDLHPLQNSNMVKGARSIYKEINNNFKHIKELADSILKSKYIDHDDLKGFRKGLETVSDPVTVTVTKTVTVTEAVKGSSEPEPKQVWHTEPREKISDAYNLATKEMTQGKFSKWSDKRIDKLKTRCKEDSNRTLQWWVDVVTDIPNHKGVIDQSWFSLDFLLESEDRLLKFVEGKYKQSFGGKNGGANKKLNKPDGHSGFKDIDYSAGTEGFATDLPANL